MLLYKIEQKSISKTISEMSSNEEIFKQSVPIYEKLLRTVALMKNSFITRRTPPRMSRMKRKNANGKLFGLIHLILVP